MEKEPKDDEEVQQPWSIGRGHLFQKFTRHVNGSTPEDELFLELRQAKIYNYSNESIENYFGHGDKENSIEKAIKDYHQNAKLSVVEQNSTENPCYYQFEDAFEDLSIRRGDDEEEKEKKKEEKELDYKEWPKLPTRNALLMGLFKEKKKNK